MNMRGQGMPAFLERRTIGFAVVLAIVGCCVLAALLSYIGGASSRTMRDYVMESLRPGLSQDEVYQILNRVGTYRIVPLGHDLCRVNDTIKSDLKDIYLHSDRWFSYTVGLYACFDDAGTLTYFRQISFP